MVSLNRCEGLKAAEENLQLAKNLRTENPDLIAGIDLSGDSFAGDARDFIPFLQFAKREGLGIAVHIAEVSILNFIRAFDVTI